MGSRKRSASTASRCSVQTKKNGTTTLLRHLKTSCKGMGRSEADEVNVSHTDDELPDRQLVLEEEARKHLASLIALHGFDPTLIENDCFKSFVGSLNPEFKLPPRLAIEEMCDGIFDEARKDLLSRLSHFHGRVSLAVGTAKTTHGEVMYTACHFIDDEWKLHQMVLDAYLVAPLPFFYGPLLGVPEVTLKSDFSDLGVPDVTPKPEFSGHAVRDILRGILEYDMDTLEKPFVMVLAMDSEMHREIKKIISLDSIYYMDKVIHSIVGKPIVLDPNFTTNMYKKVHGLGLTREKRQQLFTDIGLDHLRAYDRHWYSCYCSMEFLRKHGSCTIADKDYSRLIEVLCKIWGVSYRAIQRTSTSSYPTSNQCLTELFNVREILQSELERADGDDSIVCNGPSPFVGGNDDVVDVLRKAKDTLDRIIQDSYLVWSVPLVLDPRYKLTYIKFIFSRAFGSGGARYISEVTRKIKKLYVDYAECDGGTNGADLDGVTETAAGSSSGRQLRQTWDEHCLSGDEMDVVTDPDALEQMQRSFNAVIVQSIDDPLEQAWGEHSRSRDGRTDGSSYMDSEKELDRYLQDPYETPTEGFDILKWWKENSGRYPFVAQMARDALAMPTSSTLSSEQMAQISSIVRGYSKKKYRQSKYER